MNVMLVYSPKCSEVHVISEDDNKATVCGIKHGLFGAVWEGSQAEPTCPICRSKIGMASVYRLDDIDSVRPQVQWMAKAMEEKLLANDHKGGWESCSFGYLVTRLLEEVSELVGAVLFEGAGEFSVRSEAADVCNIAMMIADNVRRRSHSQCK